MLSQLLMMRTADMTMLDFTADNIPKVLDCGPGANNCNLSDGGQYF